METTPEKNGDTRVFGADSASHVVGILKAVAHPVRLRVVSLLCERSENVGAMAARLDVAPAIVSQQLRILRMSGLVDSTRENGFAVYRLAEPNLVKLIDTMQRCCADKGLGLADDDDSLDDPATPPRANG